MSAVEVESDGAIHTLTDFSFLIIVTLSRQREPKKAEEQFLGFFSAIGLTLSSQPLGFKVFAVKALRHPPKFGAFAEVFG